MKNTFLSRFTPSLMSAQALEDIFVQRQEEAERIVDLIHESVLTQSKHYTLLIGPRGIGKTHFVSLVYHRVCKMDDLRSGVLIAWLREEEWGVASFLDLLLRIFRALLEEYGDGKQLIPGLVDKIETLYQMSPEVAERTATAILKEVIGNRTLLLLMENLDELFAGLGEEGQLQFRAFLQENSCCTILATSQSLFNGVKLQTSPFYGFFRIRNLKDLTPEEATQLLANIAKLEEKTDLENFILTSIGYARIQAVHHLAGGSPRLYVIFSEFLTCESLNELQEPFMRMLDDLTPYYQARMQWLSPQQRKIVEILSDCRHAVPVKEVAQRSFISHQTVSSQLKDLRDMGYVTSEAVGGESFYELREPLMRFCLEVKKQRGEPIRLFVDFLRLWYTREELQQKLGLEFDGIKRHEVWDDPRQNFNEVLNDKFLPPQDSNSRYQQRLEPLAPDAVVDREYILKALEAIEQDDGEDPLLAAYLQECKNLTDNKDYVAALQYAEKLIEKRGWVQDWVLKADCLNELKRYEEALASCDKAIEIDPNYKNAWFNRTLILSNLKRNEEALASCDKAIGIDPHYKNAWVRRAWVLDNLELNEEALASCDKAIEIDPNYDWAWARRGSALDNLKRYEEAFASYDKAIEIDPNYDWAWVKRASVLDNLKRYEEALVSCDKAIEIDPNYKDAWARRGLVLNNLKRYEEALASYDKASEIDPYYEWAWANRGLVLNNLQRYEEALVSYDKAIEINPNDAWNWTNRGVALKNLKRYEEALVSYDKAVEVNSTYKWAWANRGLVLNNLQRYEEAFASYDKAIEIDSNYKWAWIGRGAALGCLKRYEEALAFFDQALEIDPNYSWAWALRGLSFENLKRYEEALSSYDKAIELNPDDAWNWKNRGDVLDKLKRYEEALASYNKAIKLDPTYKWALKAQGSLLNDLKRYEEALVYLNKAIEIDLNYESAWGSRSWTLINLGRYEEALVSSDKAIALGDKKYYVLANRAISLIGLNRWEEGIIAVEDALKNLEDKEEASLEDTELIFRILFINIQDALIWKTRITTLIDLFDKYQSIAALSQGLVRSIPTLISDTVSDKTVQLWLEVWQELVGNRPEFQISLRLLNAAVRYRVTKGDRRVLLELPIEERSLLKPLLGLTDH